jgi:hypothetical protein
MGSKLSREGVFHEMTVAPKIRIWAKAPCNHAVHIITITKIRYPKTGYVWIVK